MAFLWYLWKPSTPCMWYVSFVMFIFCAFVRWRSNFPRGLIKLFLFLFLSFTRGGNLPSPKARVGKPWRAVTQSKPHTPLQDEHWSRWHGYLPILPASGLTHKRSRETLRWEIQPPRPLQFLLPEDVEDVEQTPSLHHFCPLPWDIQGQNRLLG